MHLWKKPEERRKFAIEFSGGNFNFDRVDPLRPMVRGALKYF
jgi:hypothetical protein